MILLHVTRKFDICVEHLCQTMEAGVLEFINKHERRHIVLDNLCKQVQIYERHFPSRFKQDHEKTKRHVNEMVASVAQTFVALCVEERRRLNTSHAEKVREANKDSARRDAEQLIQEVPAHVGRKPHEREVDFTVKPRIQV